MSVFPAVKRGRDGGLARFVARNNLGSPIRSGPANLLAAADFQHSLLRDPWPGQRIPGCVAEGIPSG